VPERIAPKKSPEGKTISARAKDHRVSYHQNKHSIFVPHSKEALQWF